MTKRSYWLVLALAPALALAQNWDAAKNYTVEKKDEALAQGKKLVRDADRGINKLEQQAARASDDVKAQYREEIKDLRAKRAQAAKKLDEMGKASAGAWDEAKNGFGEAYKDLQDSYHKAVKKLK